MTSQETVTAWMQAVVDKDFERWQELSQITWKYTQRRDPRGNPYTRYADTLLPRIRQFKVENQGKVSDVLHGYMVRVIVGKPQTIQLMVVCETAPYTTDPAGTWGVNPNFWRVL